MEARLARLESDVSHLRSDVAEIKVDLRALRDKVDTKLDGLKDEIGSVKVWGLTLYVTLAGMILTVRARGFGWT